MAYFRFYDRKFGLRKCLHTAFPMARGMFPTLLSLAVAVALMTSQGYAQDLNYNTTNSLDPNAYLYGSNATFGDPVFDRYRTIDLDLDVGINSDCGRINIRNTMRAALKNVLDTKYLGDMGKNLIASSPMLLSCYFSPTWCAILKHSRIRANFLAQLRLNQCRAIDKYTDQRVSDYYEERSKCVQKQIKRTDGNFEKALESCKNYHDFDIDDWAGGKKKEFKKLIESTATWAGMSKGEGRRVVDLTKAFLGDTVIKRGSISVDFGPRRVQLTPRTYLMELKSGAHKKLCQDLLPKLMNAGGSRANVYRVISFDDLKKVPVTGGASLDHQTLLSLAHMPYQKRIMACRKLANAIALGTYTEDMGKTLDFISSKLQANPHLPTKQKKAAELKRRAFKDHVELTLTLEQQNAEPLNQVLYQINREGQEYLKDSADREISRDQDAFVSRQVNSYFLDCADGLGCPQP